MIFSATGTTVGGPESEVTVVMPVTITATAPSCSATGGPGGSSVTVVRRSSVLQAAGTSTSRETSRLGARAVSVARSPAGCAGSVVSQAMTYRSATCWTASSLAPLVGTSVAGCPLG